jgi:hypothetical protein
VHHRITNLADHLLYKPMTEADGRYNHAAMIMNHQGVITVSWKNAPLEEDTPGQRVLFSQSADGETWTKAQTLFPSINSKGTPSAQFARPFAVLNGRLYASASPPKGPNSANGRTVWIHATATARGVAASSRRAC